VNKHNYVAEFQLGLYRKENTTKWIYRQQTLIVIFYGNSYVVDLSHSQWWGLV